MIAISIFEELRPTGEASRIPDTRLDDGYEVAPRRQHVAMSAGGYPDASTVTDGECQSCGASVPDGQTKCRFCLSNHLGGDTPETTETKQESTLVGIVFAFVESSTFYGAVAKGAAAGSLLVNDVATEPIDEHQLIYDFEGEPASQLAEQWPSLPDATKTTSAAGEQLLTAIRNRLEDQGYSTFAGAQETRACLYDKRGGFLQTESRLDTRLKDADDEMWLVPGIALRELNEASNRDDQLPGTQIKRTT